MAHNTWREAGYQFPFNFTPLFPYWERDNKKPETRMSINKYVEIRETKNMKSIRITVA